MFSELFKQGALQRNRVKTFKLLGFKVLSKLWFYAYISLLSNSRISDIPWSRTVLLSNILPDKSMRLEGTPEIQTSHKLNLNIST